MPKYSIVGILVRSLGVERGAGRHIVDGPVHTMCRIRQNPLIEMVRRRHDSLIDGNVVVYILLGNPRDIVQEAAESRTVFSILQTSHCALGFNFTIPSAIRNVLITGATGSVGAPILTALLAEPTFKVTILSRGTSSATFPPSGPVIKVSDDYTLSELTAALKNQDAVISPDFTTSSLSVIEELEQQTGQKWDLDWRVSAPKLAKLREQYDAGDFNATYGLLALSFSADVDVGYDFETGQELWNERLGLPKVRLEEVIADAIKLA